MRSVVVWLALLWQGRVLAQNDVDLSALEALSPCVVSCIEGEERCSSQADFGSDAMF